MREYELIVVFNLGFQESEGQDAAPKYLENLISQRNGNVLKIEHWGRRRMAYPIDGMLDADYVLARAELEPETISEIESVFRINERVLRFLTVRADELPAPKPVEEAAPAAAATPAAATPAAPADEPTPAAEPSAALADEPAPADELSAPAPEADAAPAEAPEAPEAPVESESAPATESDSTETRPE